MNCPKCGCNLDRLSGSQDHYCAPPKRASRRHQKALHQSLSETRPRSTPELIQWLRENSSGIYRPARDAADRMEAMHAALRELLTCELTDDVAQIVARGLR